MQPCSAVIADMQDKIDFVFARSDVLDAFAELEALIGRILKSCGHPASNEPFGHRLKAFRTAGKTTFIAKANLGQRDHIADAIADLLPIRADIVHSAMRLVTFDGREVALFVNAQQAFAPYPQARIVDLVQLRGLARELRDLRKRVSELAKCVNPASSPPPPSPGAAGGP